MITPRRTRLVRVPDLQAFRGAAVALASADAAANRVVVVPTRGAARQLARTIEQRRCAPEAVLPEFATRDQLADRLYARLEAPPRRLTRFERDAMMRASADEAAAAGDAPFRIRPGLVAEMLAFYDRLRNQARTLTRFEELAEELLVRDAEVDRGAERLLRQTRFLAASFRAYERRVAASGAVDEHALRTRLLEEVARDPVRQVIVTVADWIADPNGLFLADFDLLTRIPGLDAIDLLATDTLLASGFHQRIHEWLPGVEAIGAPDIGVDVTGARPLLAVPPGGALYFRSRDREEELIAVARRVKAERRAGASAPLERTAIVYKRPLPYLYLGQAVFASARIPFEASDALPLAAQPFAAALDLVLDCVESDFARGPTIALLRSPHFAFDCDDRPLDRLAIAALDRALSEARYLGGTERLRALIDTAAMKSCTPPARVAAAIAEALSPLRDPAPASAQLARLLAFLDRWSRAPVADEGLRRGRAAILDALRALADAQAAHHDAAWTIDDLAAIVRRWIEDETFVPEPGAGGLRMLDEQAARYGDFDDITVVGLVEGEWPERPRRNIFYAPKFVQALGWPSEADRRGAEDARFLELLASARTRARVSTIELDDDALVEPSTLLDLLPSAGMTTSEAEEQPPARVLLEEALSIGPPALDVLDPAPRQWAELRLSRTSQDDPAFHGQAAAPDRAWSVSAIEVYLACPFKFFAQHVLRLDEEPDDEEAMDPRREGEFVHAVFESFFGGWQASGRQAITPDTLREARTMFAATVDTKVAALPGAEAALLRNRLLGSPAAMGLGEAVLRMEAERAVPVLHRLLEHRLEGTFTFETTAGPRAVAIKGKADRIDLLADGTFRLIDYKLGRPPGKSRALQLGVYAACAAQQLSDTRVLGRRWRPGEAAYVAFGGPKRVVPLFTSAADAIAALAEAGERLVATVDAIARGEFPPTPEDVHHCTYCAFTAVCRKDYVGDV